MSGNVCAFINCDRTRRKVTNLKMFYFPKDPVRAKKWIISSGNILLDDLDFSDLQKRVVCEHHFCDEDYINLVDKKRLKSSVVPKSYKICSQESSDLISSLPSKTYGINEKRASKRKILESVENLSSSSSSGSWIENLIDMPSLPSPSKKAKKSKEGIIQKQAEQIAMLNEKLKQKSHIISNQRSHIYKLKKTVSRIKLLLPLNLQLENHQFLMHWSRTIVKMQLKQKKRKWHADEKKFAILLYYKSPSAYKYLRQKIVLPSISIVRAWIGQSKFATGFNAKFFSQINLKSESMTNDEKKCVISFDEMCIKQYLEYSPAMDFIEGYEDMGSLGRTNRKAKYVLVFMARGMLSSWKLPLAYFFTHSGMPGENIRELLSTLIKKCFSSGLDPKAVVCDQGTSNQKCYKLLGVSKDKPHFDIQTDHGEKRIIALYDSLHLIKNYRNNLLNGNFLHNNKLISFDDIKKIYDLDRNKKCRALVKLTDKHIYPTNFQKMNVKLAVQVLSHSVSSAIRTCIETKQLQTTSAESTADFLDRMDKIFDCLNSKSFSGNKPYNCSLHVKHPLVQKTLEDAIPYIEELYKVNNKGSISRPPCFDGLIQTIKGILCIYSQEVDANRDSYILTSKLSQDVLENLFAIYRQKGGSNVNPTARVFRTLFRSNVIHNLMRQASSNYEDICEEDILPMLEDGSSVEDSGVSPIFVDEDDGSTGSSSSNPVSEANSPDHDEQCDQQETLENCATKYFAGYLAHKTIKKFSCETCKQLLLSDNIFLTDNNDILIFHRMYEHIIKYSEMVGLKSPSDELYEVIQCALNTFENKYENICCKKKVCQRILSSIRKNIRQYDFLTDDDCYDHKMYLLRLMVITKIFKTCKTSSLNQSQEKGGKQGQKLDILKHV